MPSDTIPSRYRARSARREHSFACAFWQGSFAQSARFADTVTTQRRSPALAIARRRADFISLKRRFVHKLSASYRCRAPPNWPLPISRSTLQRRYYGVDAGISERSEPGSQSAVLNRADDHDSPLLAAAIRPVGATVLLISAK